MTVPHHPARNDAVDEVRRAEFFRKGPTLRDLIKERSRMVQKPDLYEI